MELYHSPNSCLNTILKDSDGEAMYTVSTPFKLRGKISTINRVMGGKDDHYTVSQSSSSSLIKDEKIAGHSTESLPTKELISFQLASIQWKVFASSRLAYGGTEVNINEFLHPQGFACRWVVIALSLSC